MMKNEKEIIGNTIKIDYRNCVTEDDKVELLDKKIKKFNRKVHKSEVLDDYIAKMHFMTEREKRKLKKMRRYNNNKTTQNQ